MLDSPIIDDTRNARARRKVEIDDRRSEGRSRPSSALQLTVEDGLKGLQGRSDIPVIEDRRLDRPLQQVNVHLRHLRLAARAKDVLERKAAIEIVGRRQK